MGTSMSQFVAGLDVAAHQAKVRAGKSPKDQNNSAEHQGIVESLGLPTLKTIHTGQKHRIINSPEEKLNKTEARFKLEYLSLWLHDGTIDRICKHESYKLPCGAGTWIAPDFPTWKDGRLTCYEVKGGFIREDAIAKLKACATINPEITFYICQYKAGQWIIQKVEK